MDRRARNTLNRLANGGIVLGMLVAGLPFGMRAYGRWIQSRARMEFAAARAPARDGTASSPASATRRRGAARRPPRRRWQTAVIQIPSIGVDTIATEGADRWELTIGPGHILGSAGPGGRGNCIIGAHRNMWDAAFADLPRLKPGAAIYLTTTAARYTYVVVNSREVQTSDRSPLRDTPDARLTLITCVLPFDSRRRWVVQARLAG